MRLLVVTDRLSTRGGADCHLLDVIRAAAGSGLAVTIACGRVEPDLDLPPGISVRKLRGLGAATADGRGLAALAGLIAGADVVHAQNVVNPLALAQATASRRAVVTIQDHRLFCPGMGKTLPDGAACDQRMGGAPCAACLPDPAYRARILALTEERLAALRPAAKILVLSRYMADELAAVGAPAEVLPPWVAVGGPPQPGHGLLLAGRLVAHQGALGAWRAWPAADTTHPLRVAGEGPLLADLLAAEPLGWLPRPALRAALAGARALLFPAFWQEPFGILGVEALAMGTPVIAQVRGGMPDWAAAGVLPAPDEPAMTAAIRRLAVDPALALALGSAGQALVRERFAEAPLRARLLAIYEEIASL